MRFTRFALLLFAFKEEDADDAAEDANDAAEDANDAEDANCEAPNSKDALLDSILVSSSSSRASSEGDLLQSTSDASWNSKQEKRRENRNGK